MAVQAEEEAENVTVMGRVKLLCDMEQEKGECTHSRLPLALSAFEFPLIDEGVEDTRPLLIPILLTEFLDDFDSFRTEGHRREALSYNIVRESYEEKVASSQAP